MRKLLYILFFLTVNTVCFARSTKFINLRNWEFSRDSITWQNVIVPHDWAIDGPFDKKWDLQKVAIVQNGETEATEKSGRSGSLPWIGKGYYRTTINITPAEKKLLKHVEIQFDGAMADAKVRINGKYIGGWPYGYNAFRLMIDNLHVGTNTIEVSLDNKEESSRWYPGGGIYRPVKLMFAESAYIDDWHTQIVPIVEKGYAQVAITSYLQNATPEMRVKWSLYDAAGKIVTTSKLQTSATVILNVDNPKLWSPESPYLYTARAEVVDKKGNTIDSRDFKVGLRSLSFTKEHGFMLNGETRRFKGVCLHHDLGPLGAAVNKAALIRQVKILKDMGCDAIRTSHNMPSAMQMEVYDSLGMLVMAESFDMWRFPKCKNGYATIFDEWADKDIKNLVLNHRNHPSLVMWSIGNEIPEQWTDDRWGTRMAEHLQNLCHEFDSYNGKPLRPVTQGCDNADGAIASGFMQVMDIAGYNYRVHKYADGITKLPQGFLLGSETCSTVSSRGVYKFPVQLAPGVAHEDGQCSSYDTEYSPWSNTPDDDFLMEEDCPYYIGQFVWTGFDYLGEPTPYDEYWPSRSSYFGICDLAGLPKDRFYLYRSQWNKNDNTIHLLPHWTFPEREGEVTPVYCYTNYPEAELFVNGKSQGRIKKQLNQTKIATSGLTNWNEKLTIEQGIENAEKTSALDRYRLRWNNVVYEKGEIKVVVYDEKGQPAGEKTVKTAGEAKKLKLESDRTSLHADGDDLAYITVYITDEHGTLVPHCQDEIEVEVKGAGTFQCICNGDATSLEVFTTPRMKLFNGQLVATVRAGSIKGTIKVIVKNRSKNIENSIEIAVK